MPESIEETYGQIWEGFDKATSALEERAAKRIRFLLRSVLEGFSPSHLLADLSQVNAETLALGLKRFQEDLEKVPTPLHLGMPDGDAFTLGESIAATPGSVVYQNALMQLIHYHAQAEHVYQYPLLLVPAWVNKYYVFDLQKENSLVRWLVEQGFNVFVISWVNPTTEHRDLEYSHYLCDGLIQAIGKVKELTGQRQVNALGYCAGGTLLGSALAWLGAKKDSSVRSATFLTAQLDFSHLGDLGMFLDADLIGWMEPFFKARGYVDGPFMAAFFHLLKGGRPLKELFVKKYLKGLEMPSFDLAYWSADTMNIPEKLHSFFLRDLYLHNRLAQPNALEMNGVPLDLKNCTTPSFVLAAQKDHIAPWQACYRSLDLLPGPSQFVLAQSGHNAGVINPPGRNKYGYWTARKKFDSAETFLEEADFHPGSWWPHWVRWLKKYSGKLCPAAAVASSNVPAIEAAPGSYVRVRV